MLRHLPFLIYPARIFMNEEKTETTHSATIKVVMTKEALFDFFLYHAYSKLSGLLVNILGLSIFFLGVFSYAMGKVGAMMCLLAIITSVLVIAYTPFLLNLKAKKAMQEQETYKKAMDITFIEDEGILVEQEEQKTNYSWEKVERACVTPKTITIYVGDDKAVIIPKQDFGSQFVLCYQIIARSIAKSRTKQSPN